LHFIIYLFVIHTRVRDIKVIVTFERNSHTQVRSTSWHRRAIIITDKVGDAFIGDVAAVGVESAAAVAAYYSARH